MSTPTAILTITPTSFLRQAGDRLRQIARVAIRHDSLPAEGVLHVVTPYGEIATPVALTSGESTHEVEIPEVTAPCEVTCTLVLHGKETAHTAVAWTPPRHWVVHVVQLSHHDVGYTDLASHVLPEHDRWLDATIEMAAATRDFPDDARFRMVIEQTWSLDHYLRYASPGRAAAMVDLLRRGDLEVTALFGNLTTELCGHEELARSVYHAFRLKRAHGIPIVSAEHNDIPGFSWGVSQVLTEAGIRLFCPGLPKYYNWGQSETPSFWEDWGLKSVPSFWDEAALFGAEGMPGAFWWEAPSGKRVLFWCNNQGCGGGADPALPGLADRLQQLHELDYPYTVLRWPVQGGQRDNSPYIDGFTRTIRDWNARWAFPRLVCSTNARFYADLSAQLPASLPVVRGELPGQDYPVGATSTAGATAINRRAHATLPAAEALATTAATMAEHVYPADTLFAATEASLWHDEHTWGHHFPAGPTACAAELEKAVHAHRAAALAHDVASKAMARIADAVRFDEPGLHLVVFNPLPSERNGLVSTPLRELDNCGSEMIPTAGGMLRGALLNTRYHVNPPLDIVAGQFDLIDVETGESIPYQIDTLASPLGPEPYAAQRLGVGAGGKRVGFFEVPSGLARELRFEADSVPPLGYRTYRLQPRSDQPVFSSRVNMSEYRLESQFYRLELDPYSGGVRSLFDKELRRELIDSAAAHPFGAVLVRGPQGEPAIATVQSVHSGSDGPFTATLCATFSAPGHPRIEVTYTLYAGEKRLDVAVALLKDPTPLLETYAAFPFHVPDGRLRYEGSLCVVDPARDLLPGAYADRLTVQNWVAVSDDDLSMVWSSLDAPVVSLARFWPGRVSPAHSAVVRDDLVHRWQTADDLRGGAIYSLLTANNFGTNFAVSQQGTLLFRFAITSCRGAIEDHEAARIGAAFHTPLSTIFTEHMRPRPLPPTGSGLSIDHPAVRCIALKRAEDGAGLIIRLWNVSDQAVTATLSFPWIALTSAHRVSLAEEETGETLACKARDVSVPLHPQELATVRLQYHEEMRGASDDE